MEASGLIQYRLEKNLNQKDPVKMIDFYLLKRELSALIKKKKKKKDVPWQKSHWNKSVPGECFAC